MKLADATRAPNLDARIGTALLDLFALVLRQARFNAVLVGRPQLDRRDADRLAYLEQRRQVPGGGHIVSDEAEAKLEGLVLSVGHLRLRDQGRSGSSRTLKKATTINSAHGLS